MAMCQLEKPTFDVFDYRLYFLYKNIDALMDYLLSYYLDLKSKLFE